MASAFSPPLQTKQNIIKRAAASILTYVALHTPSKWNYQIKRHALFLKVFGTVLSNYPLKRWIYVFPPLRVHEALATWFLMGEKNERERERKIKQCFS